MYFFNILNFLKRHRKPGEAENGGGFVCLGFFFFLHLLLVEFVWFKAVSEEVRTSF